MSDGLAFLPEVRTGFEAGEEVDVHHLYPRHALPYEKGNVMGTITRGLAVLVLAVLLRPAVAAETRYAVPAGDSPSIGSAGAPVVIVEFLDYQ